MSMFLKSAQLEVCRYERKVSEMKERHLEELAELEAKLAQANRELAEEEKYNALVRSWS